MKHRKPSAKRPTLFDLYARPFARKNPLVECKRKPTTSYNKYIKGGGAKFRYGGGEIRVRGCDSDRPGGKSAYNVMAWTDLPRKKISKGAEFALPKSRVHAMRWRDQGNYSHIPETGRYALPPGRGERGIFGVEGYSRRTKVGEKHNWAYYKGEAGVMMHSAEIRARLKKATTKSGKARIAREIPKAVAAEKAVVQSLVAQGVPPAAAATAAKSTAIVAAFSNAPSTTIKEVAASVAADIGRQADFSHSTPAEKKAIAKKLDIAIAKEVKQEIAPASAAAAKKTRLPRKAKAASSEMARVANPRHHARRRNPLAGMKRDSRGRLLPRSRR